MGRRGSIDERSVKILECLALRGPMSLVELSMCVGDPYPSTYYTVRKLKEKGLVAEKGVVGRAVIYEITSSGRLWLMGNRK